MAAQLNIKRAGVCFTLAYIAITILAFWLYIGILAITGQPIDAYSSIREDPAYLLAEKLFPLLNLLVWTTFSWLYFRKPANKAITPKTAWRLGLFWLLIAVPLDFLGFVVIKTPMSLSASDFYIGQFPWIYLIYVAIAVSPLCWLGLKRLTLASATTR